MELLAPAGSREALIAAVAAGADAVYLGYTAFGARAGAVNFDDEAIAWAIGFCRLYHVRVYVTVNTLIKDQEMRDADRVLGLVEGLGADGIIVQDLGIAALAREKHPGLALHASTQMAVHNASGALFLKRSGFERVVLARECALKEIQRAAQAGLAVEVFVHGALCCSVSGQCLFSSTLGQRSGNRGRCAQPCRLNYSFGEMRGALLSPRDLMLRDKLPELKKAGVTSLKIEGRMKRPEYVYVVTDAYRKALDELEAGRFHPADREEREALMQIFHRGGFMPGYAFGCQDAGVIAPERVNHFGVTVGRVTRADKGFAYLAMAKPLHDGDQLQLRGLGPDEEAVYSGPPIPAGGEAKLRLRPGSRAQAGQEAARLTDASQMAAARKAAPEPIPVWMELWANVGEALCLTVSDGESKGTVWGTEVVQAAKSRPFSKEDGERSLGKLGDTPFRLEGLTVFTRNAFVPVSQLNDLRRRAAAELIKERVNAFGPSKKPRQEVWRAQPSKVKSPWGLQAPGRLIAWCRTLEQAKAAFNGADQIWLEPEDLRPQALESLLNHWPRGAWLTLPVQCREDTLQTLWETVLRHRSVLGGVTLGSIGQLGREWPLPVAAGPGVPVMNGPAARELAANGVTLACASAELSEEEWQGLIKAGVPLALPVYGRTRLMVLNHCPARTALGLDKGRESCRLCDEDRPESLRGRVLNGRRGAEYPMLRTRLPEGCLVSLYNNSPLNLTMEAPRLQALGSSLLFSFTLETGEETEGSLKAALMGREAPGGGVTGHFRRPVE